MKLKDERVTIRPRAHGRGERVEVCAHEDSNPDYGIRNPVSYPLNDGRIPLLGRIIRQFNLEAKELLQGIYQRFAPFGLA